MSNCQLEHIPKRLWWDGNYINDMFYVGEKVYRRSKAEELSNPFKSITLTELSVNRSGESGEYCEESDVLLCLRPDLEIKKYDLEICKLEVKDVSEEKNTYYSFKKEVKNSEEHVGEMILLHDPLPCMMPHSLFRISINGEVVTYKNSKKTIQKFNKIRTFFKQELAKMIIRKEIKQPTSD